MFLIILFYEESYVTLASLEFLYGENWSSMIGHLLEKKIESNYRRRLKNEQFILEWRSFRFVNLLTFEDTIIFSSQCKLTKLKKF